ncbi:KPN_02809 family neutral zinc metallopeptidase [Frischella perrara]|jgi:Predicted metalloprotease|uniref:Putative metalloprotease n=1 Tax=Frischella perrara TaxID=1267021 RepID=A0A0A7S9P7_FRIPE|nr:neutral zinc metallopeptidase [Frischella perrara]AJA46051.1 putative metalloprotease [Frischella perrara]MCT6874997.1 neutral zinc metallopeptidase [Frischella perrara]PWV61312.1 hypothetical protein C7375_10759 [Frischella perrara]
MRWQNKRESTNIEDRRSQTSSQLGNIPLRGKSGLIVFIIILVAGYYGVDLTGLLNSTTVTPTDQSVSYSQEDEEATRFTSVILASTEDYWSQEFHRLGKSYTPAKLVLYRGSTRTGCGVGQSIMGPFYCSADRTLYLDLSFYQEMKQRLGGGGEFAQGYVIAHEVAHHVQNLLGTFDYVANLRQGNSSAGKNQLSVKLELQADCYAGMWGHAMQQENILEVGDIDTALKTAQAIGDDRLQKQQQGYVVPDSFTHGTSQQRYNWFKRGFDSGNIKNCDTFAD